MSKTTIKDVARLAGVSVTTVSQILNKKKEFPSDTVEKVMDIVKQTKYTANFNARKLRGNTNKQILVIIPSIFNNYFSSLLAEINKFIFSNNLAIDLSFKTTGQAGLTKTIEDVANQGIDGLIIADTSQNIKTLQPALENINIPYTILDRPTFDDNIHSNSIADYLGGQKVAEYLANLGHSHVAMLTPNFHIENLAIRQKGFLDYWDTNVHSEVQVVGTKICKEGGRNAAKQIYKNVTAVFCVNDELGIGLIRGFHDLGISVPDKVSVIGFDGIDASKFCIPSLTTMNIQRDQAVFRFMSKLLNQFDDFEYSIDFEPLLPKLIIRESTKKILEND